jgi:hypothetical protein
MPHNTTDKRPLKDRAFVYSQREAGELVGYTLRSIENWIRTCGGFPVLPTTKSAIWAWLQRIHRPVKLYRQRGPTRRAVIPLWEKGLGPEAIAQELQSRGISVDQPGVTRHIQKELKRRALERVFGVR